MFARLMAVLLTCAAVTPAQALELQLFGDVAFSVAPGEDEASFEVGALGIYAKEQVGPDFTILSETVVELDDEFTSIDIDRLSVDYTPTEWLGFRLGRDHVPLGYYSQAFHHTLLYQLAAERPFIVEFENNEGPLPAHFVGLIVHGRFALGEEAGLRYQIGVGNGRGDEPERVLSDGDEDPVKALVAQFALVDPLPGLELGLSGYLDEIPAGGALETRTKEQILSGHVVYRLHPVDLITEGHWIRHEGEESTQLFGGFFQFGYSFGLLQPYMRYEQLIRDVEDEWIAEDHPAHREFLRLGLHISPHERVVLKLEYAVETEETVHEGLVQAAFGL